MDGRSHTRTVIRLAALLLGQGLILIAVITLVIWFLLG